MSIENEIVDFINNYEKPEITPENILDISCDISESLFPKIMLPILNDFVINDNGHNNNRLNGLTIQTAPEYEIHRLEQSLMNSHFYNLPFTIKQVLENKAINKEHIDKLFKSFKIENYCFQCGKHVYLRANFDNKTFETYTPINNLDTSCIKSNSNGQFSFKHSFPSGKIVFANDLRHVLSEDFEDNIDKEISKRSGYNNSIQSYYGKELNSKIYSEAGLVYITVGNSSPHIFYDNKNNTITAKRDYFYDKVNDIEIDTITENETDVGYICTDLWAICAMDYDLFVEKCKNKKFNKEEIKESIDFTLDVEPGDYEITSYYDDLSEKIKYFVISKI